MIENIGAGVNGLVDHVKSEIKLLVKQPGADMYELALDVIGKESLEVSSEVTKYYVENNTWYNDNISVKPQIYRLQGEVGELYWYNKDPKQSYVGYVNQKLMPIAEFTPVRSALGQQFMNQVTKIQSYLEVGANLWDRVTNMTAGINHQQQAYIILDTLFNLRIPFKVDTPWATKLVVITSAVLEQPEFTRDRTRLNITYEEFRVAQMSSVKFNREDYRGRIEQSLQPTENNGQQTGELASFYYNVGKSAGVKK